MFDRSWWQVWDRPDKSWPKDIEYVVASLDSAFTTKERNDPSGFTVWGVFPDKDGKSRVILMHAWRKHLAFSGPRLEPLPGEGKEDHYRRTSKQWGLMEWVKYSCEKFKVDTLLIEAKASGISAAQELNNRYGRLAFGVHQTPVKGDKMARALAVQWVFARQLVYAPVFDWSEMVMEEMEKFPLYKYDDLTDSATQAIRHLVMNGILISDDEHEARVRDAVTHVSRSPSQSRLSFW
jgi:predicted phage terminase large subunit-like protein